MRKKLSNSGNRIMGNIIIGFIFLLPIIYIAATIDALRKGDFLLLPLIVFTLIGVALFVLARYIKNIKEIEFDSEKIYILERNVVFKSVPLDDVIEIGMTIGETSGSSIWKIIYAEKNGRLASCPFNPSIHLQEFIDILRSKNRKVRIKNWAGPIDL